MNKEEFIEKLKEININITNFQLLQLEKYKNILIDENNKYNLTRITEDSEIYLKHFYDSLTISKIIDLKNQKLIDIGTGAGFPGIVLKIIYPDLDITLLESSNKKCEFLKKVITNLELKKVNVVNNRAEEYSKQTREKYDIVVSRAVAKTKILLELSIPLLKINGSFIAMKANLNNELDNIDNYCQKLKIKLEKIENFKLPIEESVRNLVLFIKIDKTDLLYPRKYQEILKKEL